MWSGTEAILLLRIGLSLFINKYSLISKSFVGVFTLLFNHTPFQNGLFLQHKYISIFFNIFLSATKTRWQTVHHYPNLIVNLNRNELSILYQNFNALSTTANYMPLFFSWCRNERAEINVRIYFLDWKYNRTDVTRFKKEFIIIIGFVAGIRRNANNDTRRCYIFITDKFKIRLWTNARLSILMRSL